VTWSEEVYYLDTSALVKRYVSEPGSNVVDNIFSGCYRGVGKISFSYWNVAEAAVVFDKYERRLGLNARELLRNLLREMKTLTRLHRLIIVEISPRILKETVKLVLKHHIYVADALQIATALKVKGSVFVTGDRDLARIAEAEKLRVLYAG
jgi:predicted nucleic acid-binding protein